MRMMMMMIKSELNGKNKITAIGTLDVAVLRYSFGIINTFSPLGVIVLHDLLRQLS
jgi:hypothetical protein